MKNVLIRGGTIVRSSGEQRADVFIDDGKIASRAAADAQVIDAAGMLVLPGLIDCHVHFREPGYEHKATMQSEAAAALAGGVTTVCEMPNTLPPTVTIAALADKVRRAGEIRGCDIRFYFGITEAAHLAALKDLWIGDSAELRRLKARCSGVKLYLDHSTGNQKVEGGIVEDIFKTCAELSIPLIGHCEDPEMNAAAAKANTSTAIAAHSVMRPPEAEAKAIAFAIDLVRKHGAPFHVAHLSTALGLDLVRRAKAEGLPVTCEVAPHHLFLSTDDYASLGTLGKMNPPLRSKDDLQALWDGIADGTVDCVATDHAPHTLKEKGADPPLSAPSGVPGVETMLPLLLMKLKPTAIVRLCFENPNRIFGLGKKGIVEGALADVIIVDPKKEWTIRGSELHSKCGWTPFEGWEVTGKVVKVL